MKFGVVFPAYAGVNPIAAYADTDIDSIPRVCGGEPKKVGY